MKEGFELSARTLLYYFLSRSSALSTVPERKFLVSHRYNTQLCNQAGSETFRGAG